MTPLHIACHFGYSQNVIRALLQANPTVFTLVANNGKTPLMMACACRRTKPATLKILLNHDVSIGNPNDAAISHGNDNGDDNEAGIGFLDVDMTDVKVDASQCNWHGKDGVNTNANANANRNPNTTTNTNMKQSTDTNTDSQGKAVIHDNAPTLPTHTDATQWTFDEWSPLHMAVLNNASVEMIQLLCDAYPESCHQKTPTSKQTPLGLYWSGHGDDVNIVRLLLKCPLQMSSSSRSGDDNHNDNDNDNSQHFFSGVIHQVLSFPQFIPGLLEFVLEKFANHVQIR
jgi:ankyrin repeat protein